MDNERKQLTHGLPPLPKSLSLAVGGALGSVHGAAAATPSIGSDSVGSIAQSNPNESDIFLGPSTSAAAMRQRHTHRHGSLSSTQESLSDRESVHSRASSTHSHNSNYTTAAANNNELVDTSSVSALNTTCTLDTQIAILRREMYGLRQLDLSLLSQLWALNESIQGFRLYLQENDVLSPPSPSPTASDTNSIGSEPDDESSISAPPKIPQTCAAIATTLPAGSITSHASSSTASGASGSSSATSSVGGGGGGRVPGPAAGGMVKHIPAAMLPQKQHPQLPRILQQRMRRAPPPPPPARPKQLAAQKPIIAEHRPV